MDRHAAPRATRRTTQRATDRSAARLLLLAAQHPSGARRSPQRGARPWRGRRRRCARVRPRCARRRPTPASRAARRGIHAGAFCWTGGKPIDRRRFR